MDQATGEPRQDSVGPGDMARKQSLKSLVTRIAIDFLHVKPELVDESICQALAAVGEYLETERCFVLLLNADEDDTFHIAYDWSSNGQELTCNLDSGADGHSLPWLLATLRDDAALEVGLAKDWPDDAQREKMWMETVGIHSTIVVPMISDNGVVGAIGVGSMELEHAWPGSIVALLRIIGDIFVTVRERKTAHTALQHRIDAEEVIRSIATLVIGLTADKLDEGYARALESIGEFLEVDRCYLRLSSLTENGTPQIAAWRSERSAPFDDEMHTFDMIQSFPSAASILAQNQNIVINSLADIPEDAVSEKEILQRFDIRAAIFSPIHANEKLAGVLVAEMNHSERDWSDIDIMLVSIAAQVLGGMRVRQIVEDERGRLESQVHHAQKLESMGVFAGGIAHDFNNLLVGILGNAELMLMDTPPEHARRKSLEQIESSARRAADLVNQLLTYTGKGQFRVEPLDVSELIENLTTLVRTVIPKKIDVQAELEDDLPMVAGDATQLRQIIMNLVTNAADAIGDTQGKILMYTGFGAFDADSLRHTVAGAELKTGDYVIIEVTDTGCGMDDATKAKIFDPFFTTKFAGRGLGLAATLGIVRAHHGTIKVMSWPQKGTTIQVLLPTTTYTRPEKPDVPENIEPAQEGGTILVIDDEISVRRLTQSVLEHFGYDVLVAENGMRGLRVLEQNPNKVDVVILDMSMPKMDGEETLRRIRELGEQVPVVLTSGYTEVEINDRVGKLDASAFIGKPFSPKDLIQQIRKLI